VVVFPMLPLLLLPSVSLIVIGVPIGRDSSCRAIVVVLSMGSIIRRMVPSRDRAVFDSAFLLRHD